MRIEIAATQRDTNTASGETYATTRAIVSLRTIKKEEREQLAPLEYPGSKCPTRNYLTTVVRVVLLFDARTMTTIRISSTTAAMPMSRPVLESVVGTSLVVEVVVCEC